MKDEGLYIISNEESTEKRMRTWLNAQRIGIAAYGVMMSLQFVRVPLLCRGDGQKYTELVQEFRENLQLALYDSLREHLMEQDDSSNLQNRLSQLPPVVLYLLNNLLTKPLKNVPEFVRDLKNPVKEAIIWLDKSYPRTPSCLGKAQIIAYHIFDSVASARRLIRLGLSLGGRSSYQWQNPWNSLLEDPARIEQLEELLRKIRIPHLDTESTLFTICQLGDILRRIPIWPQLENILISQTFCWPLLVFGDEKNDLGISLPVSIDITFDDKGEVEIRPEGIQSEGNVSGGVDASQWRENLETSVKAAKDLWLGKHGNYGVFERWRSTPTDFRYRVYHSSVTFDFLKANHILGNIKASLREGSADSYFAMAVLGRFLGRRRHISSAVMGLIGERCKNKKTQKEELDYWVKSPGGIFAKLHYLVAKRTIERVAVAEETEIECALKNLLRGKKKLEDKSAVREINNFSIVKIASGAKLSNLADIVQVEGWRQYRFIRCPEIQWAVHDEYYSQRQGLLTMNDTRVRYVMNLLRENKSFILDLMEEQDVTPRIMGSALWHINMTLRNQMSPKPPMFSCLFVRATPDQQGSRFWEVLWNGIGAPLVDFEQLYSVSSPKKAATVLTETLNRFQPLETSPGYRSPDLIIIIGLEQFLENLEEIENPLRRPLDIVPVLREITSQGQLRIAPNAEALSSYLRKTRIILLPDHPDKDLDLLRPRIAPEELDIKDQAIISALSTFRWGFTHSMVPLLLDTAGIKYYMDKLGSIHNYLNKLHKNGTLRYCQGWYHFPSTLRKELYQSIPEVEKVKYHIAAGTALAPYTKGKAVPAMAFDQVFLPEHIYEALFHFNRAQWLATIQGNQMEWLGQMALNQKTAILRFTAFPSWSTIGSLTQCGNAAAFRDAYKMGCENVDVLDKNIMLSLHPGFYLNIARAGVAWYKNETRTNVKVVLGEELIGEEGIFEKALNACENPRFCNELDYNRLCVLSEYSTHLAQIGGEHSKKVKAFDREILRLLESNVDGRGVKGEWFERLGDGIKKHSEALSLYRLGIKCVPQWHQLWIKAFGTLTNPDRILASLQEYAVRESLTMEKAIAYIVRTADKRWNPYPPQWVKDRWNRGLKLIDEVWGYTKEVQDALQGIQKYT
jgi:hypothetical protein